MKKIFALPGILLPISILVAGAFIGNSALDIRMNGNSYSILSTNLYQLKFVLPFFISWIFYIVLGFIKQPPKKWAWLQVTVTIICVVVFYLSLNSPMGPRLYYDDNTFGIQTLLGLGGANLSLAVVTFYITQIAFWVYGIIMLVKGRQSQKKKWLFKR